jgi:hypothetical protein
VLAWAKQKSRPIATMRRLCVHHKKAKLLDMPSVRCPFCVYDRQTNERTNLCSTPHVHLCNTPVLIHVTCNTCFVSYYFRH